MEVTRLEDRKHWYIKCILCWYIKYICIFCHFLNTETTDSLKSLWCGGQGSVYTAYPRHGCWCPGDTRSQGISSNGIDLIFLEYSGFSTGRFCRSWYPMFKSSYCKSFENEAPPWCLDELQIFDNMTRHPGGRLNIKMPSYQYRDSHVKDKTVSPTVLSLTWEFPYLVKTVFILRQGPGGRLNTRIKMSYQYRDSNVKDKTVLWPSYL